MINKLQFSNKYDLYYTPKPNNFIYTINSCDENYIKEVIKILKYLSCLDFIINDLMVIL